MDVGLHVKTFTWPGSNGMLSDHLAAIAVEAEQAGFAKLSVMDHLWQISTTGPAESEMLEAYTTLGFLAGVTKNIELLACVTAVTHREPGLLAKAVTTLDVLSKGRAWLGIGAAWNEEESRGLGVPFPPMSERFERLEEAVQVCLQMWSEDDQPYVGKHYRLERTLNSPMPIRKPHPPILIGGGGERKTLRLVARYAQACNLLARNDLEHKLTVLRRHCADVGRNYDEIQKTVLVHLDPGARGEHVGEVLAELDRLSHRGISHAHVILPYSSTLLRELAVFGDRIIPAARGL